MSKIAPPAPFVDLETSLFAVTPATQGSAETALRGIKTSVTEPAANVPAPFPSPPAWARSEGLFGCEAILLRCSAAGAGLTSERIAA